ncbi:hypothetical protein [Catenovulum sediminis]|uniref:Metallo-beta-lactamase domain-containing protein n=1 Tax=Catenovulum sediminis TaxID=1740262 RepID=A0ABV1RCB0_9ALTE
MKYQSSVALLILLNVAGCQFTTNDTDQKTDNVEEELDCSVHVASNRKASETSVASYSNWLEAEHTEHNLIVKTEEEEGFVTGSTSGDLLRMEKTSELFVRWDNIHVLEDGLTEFVLKAASPWGSKVQNLTIWNESGEQVYKDDAFTIFASSDNPKEWQEYPIYVELAKGQYSLEVGDDWGYVFFDALRVRDQTVIVNSELNLEQINYYKSTNNPIELNIAYNHNKLFDVVVNGNSIPYDFVKTCNNIRIDEKAIMALPRGTYDLRIIYDQGEDSVASLRIHDEIEVPKNNRYEAELQSMGRGVTIVMEDSSASNRSFVSNENFGSVEYVVVVPKKGKYEFSMRYKAPNSDAKRKLHINGKRYRTALGVRYAKEWDSSPSWILPLEEGANTIRLSPDYGYLELDYLQLSAQPVLDRTEIHPKQTVAFLGDYVKPVRYKVDPVNHSLVSIKDISGQVIDFKTKKYVISDHDEEIAILEDGFHVILQPEQINKMGVGKHELSFEFDDGRTQKVELEIMHAKDNKVAALTLTFFDVSHGLAVLMQLPDGTSIMADAGKHDINEQRVRPFMIANKVKLDEIWTSHRHGDHYGGKEKLLEAYGHITSAFLKDNQSLEHWNDNECEPAGELPFKRGDILHYGDATITVQNAHGDHCKNNYLDFNPNSLAFRLDYKGFRFGFQGDIYGQQQDEHLATYGENAIKVDVLQSNHHWHGSISPDYVKKTNADLIIVSASEHVWGAGSFTQDGLSGVRYLRDNNPDFKERLMTFDVGHVVVKVFEDGSWTYETINSQSVHYVEDPEVENVMGYPVADLEKLKVGNFVGYPTEERTFPIP